MHGNYAIKIKISIKILQKLGERDLLKVNFIFD